MRCTDILSHEHELLKRLLDELEQSTRTATKLGYLEAGPVNQLLHFFEHLGDGLHQEKEERVLFPLLVVGSGGLDGLEIERLSHEHAADRRRLTQMRLHLLGAVHGEPVCLEIFVTNATSYVSTQRKHLSYEEETLLPLAQRILTEDQDRMAVAGFRRVEHESGFAFEAAALHLLSSLAKNRIA